MKLNGRHVIVTGAAAGIGRAICLRFAQEGARVSILRAPGRCGMKLCKTAAAPRRFAATYAIRMNAKLRWRRHEMRSDAWIYW